MIEVAYEEMSSQRWIGVILILAAMGWSCRRTPPHASRGVVIGQITSAVTLDPHKHDEFGTFVTLSNFYDTLVGFGSEMELQPQLAIRWENLSDTVWRFHLRHGVIFHNGQAFGAEDVITSLRRAQSTPDSQVSYYLQSLNDLRRIDDLTVELVTRDPAPILLNKLTSISIVPRTTGAETITQPIGTGSYRFVSGVAGGVIQGERFDRYWGARPAYARATIVSIPEARDRAAGVFRGRADVIAQYPEEFWAWGHRQAGAHLISRNGLEVVMLGFSFSEGSPFRDVRLRRAIARTVDRELLASRGMRGLAVRLDQMVPADVFGYSPELKGLARDPAAAKALLREAGAAGGLDAPIFMPDYLEGAGRELARQLGALGIRLRPTVLPWPVFEERSQREKLPISLFGWSPGSGDISDVLDALLHSPAGAYGTANRFSYVNRTLDSLIEESDKTLIPGSRREIVTEAVQIVAEDIPVLPLLLRRDLYAVSNEIEWKPRLDRFVRAIDMRPKQQ